MDLLLDKKCGMKIGIMQPYFLPYIGYFQLIKMVDKFVIYDNIKYTKKGWINRNRILVKGRDEFITLPLKNASDHLDVNQRRLADSFPIEKRKILSKVRENYQKAVYFSEVYELLEEVLDFEDMNLFQFVLNSLKMICRYLEIDTEFVISSTLPIDHTLKAEDKVLAICKNLDSDEYVNPIGGLKLYSRERFRENNIRLQFLGAKPIFYPQLANEFVPNLSILDVIMFNHKESISIFLKNEFELM